MKKLNWQLLLLCVMSTLCVGFLFSKLSGSGQLAYSYLYKPAGAPPGWVFPVVWTVLYVLMGLALYFMLDCPGTPKQRASLGLGTGKKSKSLFAGLGTSTQTALVLYVLQLVVNGLWSVFFFGLYWYLFALLWTFLLMGLVYLTFKQFIKICPIAGLLLLPYMAWLVYAAYLNYGFWLLNG